MASSPYIPQDVKSYIRKYELQKLINQSVNSLLKNKPDDPYAYLIGQFQKLASTEVQITSFKGLQIITGEGFPALKLYVTCIYNNKEMSFLIGPLGILSDEGTIWDEDRLNGKGQIKGINFLEKQILPLVSGLKCSQQFQIDSRITKQFANNNNLGLYQINTVSYLPSLIQSHILSKQLYEIFSEVSSKPLKQGNPSLIVNCLQGGKAIGSKCKVFKYLLICNNIKDPWLIQTVMQAIRKNIASGKAGEAGVKLSPDGTFICPVDLIMQNLKIVQDAIISSGAKDFFSVGLSWMADSLFTVQTKKYELQNPKTPFDNDQMIDYLVKLLVDKPIIQYLEDPLASSQKAAWKKLIAKIKSTEAIKNVKIGTRNGKLINLNDNNVKEQISQISIEMTEQTHPNITEEERKTANNSKFCLDYVQCRAFQLKTLSKLLSVDRQLSKVKSQLILQDNSYQTYDTTLIDLAYGLGCYANLGSINKYDRICKLGRISEIICLRK